MDYDFRNRNPPASGTEFAAFYRLTIGQQGPRPVGYCSPPASPGFGVRVAIKPEYRMPHPPPLAKQMAEVPQSTFQFNFDFEKEVLADIEQEDENRSRMYVKDQPANPSTSSPTASAGDLIVDKYVASGLGREAVLIAVLNFGDNPDKVKEFVKGYYLLCEMGFSTRNLTETLIMYDNDTDKAIEQFVSSSP